MERQHTFEAEVEWTGDRGTGTTDYRSYGREHVIRAAGKPDLPGSSAPAFRGDPSRYDPEELLVASLSACHMLWYLHFCAVNGIVVVGYIDRAHGTLAEEPDGGGRFVEVVLRPRVRISRGDPALAARLHEAAHEKCFIARSVNFPVRCEPTLDAVNARGSAPGSP
ncbi:MAG: OsmC family protein [Thermoplasmata archaeon]